jgi:hypothetical protein
MYQEDRYNPADQNDYDVLDDDNMFEKAKRQDKGYNVIYRKALRKDGRKYNKKIVVYSSSGRGNRIRDAETGEYFDYIVGSKDEDLFFKVMLATGECTSVNGSYTLFYASPEHYFNHLHCDPEPEIATGMTLNWQEKRDARLTELKREKKRRFESIEVR